MAINLNGVVEGGVVRLDLGTGFAPTHGGQLILEVLKATNVSFRGVRVADITKALQDSQDFKAVAESYGIDVALLRKRLAEGFTANELKNFKWIPDPLEVQTQADNSAPNAEALKAIPF